MFAQNQVVNKDKTYDDQTTEKKQIINDKSESLIESLQRVDSISASDSLKIAKSSSAEKKLEKSLEKKIFSPTPKKALIHALIFPGLGQIYNRKYWKLPIVYGGFLGVTYAVSWNGNLYGDYKKAYKDIVTDPQGTTSWHNFVNDPQAVLNNPALMQKRISWMKRRRDYFRRNRDLGIIIGVGLYALCILDAYVDASLYDFNVSPNLSMSIYPYAEKEIKTNSKPTFGLNLNLKF